MTFSKQYANDREEAENFSSGEPGDQISMYEALRLVVTLKVSGFAYNPATRDLRVFEKRSRPHKDFPTPSG